MFTTGGIGPTHDDITADSIAKAFGVTIDVDPRARAIMEENYKARGIEMNEARLRMARMPAGAELLKANQGPPGFTIGNVFVMAGVPSIMQVMLDAAAPMLKTGVKMLSETIRATCARATSAPSSARSPSSIRTSRSAAIRSSTKSAGRTPIW